MTEATTTGSQLSSPCAKAHLLKKVSGREKKRRFLISSMWMASESMIFLFFRNLLKTTKGGSIDSLSPDSHVVFFLFGERCGFKNFRKTMGRSGRYLCLNHNPSHAQPTVTVLTVNWRQQWYSSKLIYANVAFYVFSLSLLFLIFSVFWSCLFDISTHSLKSNNASRFQWRTKSAFAFPGRKGRLKRVLAFEASKLQNLRGFLSSQGE